MNFLDDFDRPLTVTYFLDVCVGVSVKLTTSGSFGGKQISKIITREIIILKQNERVRPK